MSEVEYGYDIPAIIKGIIISLCAFGIFAFGYFIGTEAVMNDCRDYGKYNSGGIPSRVFICQEQK